jgi:fermentation-respiration switch protein FrsA (DUF1100 family)
MRRRRRAGRTTAIVLVLLVLLVLTVVAAIVIAPILLTRPVPARIGDPPSDLHAVNVAFRSASGATVRGWWCRVADGGRAVLLLPGVRANRLSMIERARFLRRAGYSVLLIDLQATGESSGDAITFGWRERFDVLAAAGFLRTVQHERRIAIIGSSLGGAAALLATPPLRVDALIVEAVYPTIEAATTNRLTRRLGPLGSLLVRPFLAQLRPRLGVTAGELRPIDHIAAITCPLFIISGSDDRYTTAGDTRALAARAHAPLLWLVPRAGHVDLHRAALAEYERRVLAFLEGSLNHGESGGRGDRGPTPRSQPATILERGSRNCRFCMFVRGTNIQKRLRQLCARRGGNTDRNRPRMARSASATSTSAISRKATERCPTRACRPLPIGRVLAVGPIFARAASTGWFDRFRLVQTYSSSRDRSGKVRLVQEQVGFREGEVFGAEKLACPMRHLQLDKPLVVT